MEGQDREKISKAYVQLMHIKRTTTDAKEASRQMNNLIYQNKYVKTVFYKCFNSAGQIDAPFTAHGGGHTMSIFVNDMDRLIWHFKEEYNLS